MHIESITRAFGGEDGLDDGADEGGLTLRALFAAFPSPLLIEQDERIVFANAAATSILGYDDALGLVGRSYAELVCDDDRGLASDIAPPADAGPTPWVRLRWCDTNQRPVWVEVSRLRSVEAGIATTITIAHDITTYHEAQEQLSESLDASRLLLREIHHRVKNNLQLVSSMLGLGVDRLPDEHARTQLREAIARIRTIGLVHEHLYRSRDLSRLDTASYLKSLVRSVADALDGAARGVETTMTVDRVRLDADRAVACGLIVCELVTNAIKHAFVGRAKGRIDAGLRRQGGEAVLHVADDGNGLPAGFAPEHSSSLGFEIVQAFTRQLEGTLSTRSGPGTTVEVRFPLSS